MTIRKRIKDETTKLIIAKQFEIDYIKQQERDWGYYRIPESILEEIEDRKVVLKNLSKGLELIIFRYTRIVKIGHKYKDAKVNINTVMGMNRLFDDYYLTQ